LGIPLAGNGRGKRLHHDGSQARCCNLRPRIDRRSKIRVRELRQIAARRGWEVVEQYGDSDAGISGSKGRDDRPGLDQMLKDAQRRRFDVVMAWAIDRLGRSLIDLLGTIQALQACGVDLYLDQQSIDTTTPAGRLMFQVTGAFAEFERSMIRQRINAGLKRTVEAGKTLGRPRISEKVEKRIQEQLRAGKGINKVAREVGVGTGTVQRIAQETHRPFIATA
jgi:DNA invertase Pin-like site-specific DNA recombinase